MASRGIESMVYLRKILLFVSLFLFVFAPRVNFGPGINLGLAPVLLVALMNIDMFSRLSFPRPFAVLVSFFLFIGLYSYCMAAFYGNEPDYFSGICISAIICVIFGWGYARTYCGVNDPDSAIIVDLIYFIVLAILINSAVMLFEYFVPDVKNVIEAHLVQADSSNIDYAEHPFRLRGLASAGGAALSIVNALGIIFVIFLVRRRAMTGIVGLVVSVVITLSNIFTGRTGLIASLVFVIVLFVMLFWNSMRSGTFGILRAVGLLLITWWFVSSALHFDLDAEASRWAFEWVDGLSTGKLSSASSDDLGSMLFLPTDTIDLLFGAGFFEGEHAKYMRSDSGYVKTVLSIGLLFGSLMYAFIGWLFYKVALVSREFFWMVSAVLVFFYFVEIKEPFLYQNYSARVLFLLSGSAWFIIWHRKFESSTLS